MLSFFFHDHDQTRSNDLEQPVALTYPPCSWRPPNHLLVLPGLLTSAHESKKITRLMAEAKSRNWSALSLDYFGCFSNHGHIWSGIHQPVPHSSACDISWIRWQKDIVDALDRVGWLHQQQPVPDLQRLNHKLTIVGCSAGFALALDVFCERGRSLARRFTAGIHLIGVGASPDPRSRWRKDGVLDGHWIWVPSPYANHSRGYPLPIGLVTEASPVAAECVIPGGGGGGGGQTDPLRVTMIHGDADEVIALSAQWSSFQPLSLPRQRRLLTCRGR
ncbi:hypothetical protein BCR44DRAFT_1099919 [Catenaria anguillulae PL171]|uniref:Alpha/Beta hydrolase protein n=1 Tax=Catenaria anguillulae PL171 TaxID=765915 RepID=A0A1Y2I1N5_9FUNG|nr:hypothetical protein BCR44DRAFT_1099919 [Catenaria anguillulae PL171]